MSTLLIMDHRRLLAIIIGMALTGSSMIAQSKLDLQSRSILRMQRSSQAKMKVDARTKSVGTVKETPASHITGFIKLADGATADQLEAEGIDVLSIRENIALVAMPLDDVERIAELECVKRVEISREERPQMDVVRQITGAAKIQSGEDLPKAYTGKGVVTGIVDGGLDPNHINFKNADGTPRISYLSHIYATEASSQGFRIDEYSTAERIANFTTDNDESFHGTHTLGIMAGGYRGKATFGEQTGEYGGKVVEKENPYYGMAPESDIVASCGTLADMFIAYGIEGILNYRYYNNKPAVINLSLGNNTGPHDGSSIMCQYLAKAAEEAIICIASGNSGNNNIVLSKEFTATDTKTQTFIQNTYPIDGYNNLRYGEINVYSRDASEITVKTVIYNKSRGTIVFELPISENTDGESIYYSAGDDYYQEGDKTHANFTKAFNGYIGMGSMTDPDNGRYYVLIDYNVEDNPTTNADGKYVLGLVVEGKDGQRADCYCDGAYTGFTSLDQAGWEEGSADGSVSDMATAKNVIVVGSYNCRETWPSIDGYLYSYQGMYPEGKISDFSSYGTLTDGRKLPHVCAPGTTVISSSNYYYVENDSYLPMTDGELQGKLVRDGRTDYWHQSLGTSMACPVVAGGIALWLEADPTLTVDDVKEIIASTSVTDADVLAGNPVQWGAGKFDAYAGLKEVIRRTGGVADLKADNNRLMVTSADGRAFNVFVGGAQRVDATIYSIAGLPVASQSAEADELTIDASALPAGCYILTANGQSQKIIVK